MKIQLPSTLQLSQSDILAIIEYHEANLLPRLKTLDGYYRTKHKGLDEEIVKRNLADPTKANNKLITNFPQYITDTATGYFMGTPVSYSSDNDYLQIITDILNFNYEQDENYELAKNCSIYGEAYEILYVDNDANVRFDIVDNKSFIPVYDLEGNIQFAIYYQTIPNILTKVDSIIVDIYYKDHIERWSGLSLQEISLEYSKPHYFDKVPVVIYLNNSDSIGDFEDQISLIDNFEIRLSDCSNQLDSFSNAMLIMDGVSLESLESNYTAIENINGVDTEVIHTISAEENLRKMKETKVLVFEPSQDGQTSNNRIYYINSNIDNTANENLLNVLKNQIHIGSKVPDLTDENFVGNSSGVAIKYKLIAFENLAGMKERKFKSALLDRIELICNFISKKQANINAQDINITFNRSLPQNLLEVSNIIKNFNGIVPTDVLLKQIPFISQQELETIKKEQEDKAIADAELAKQTAMQNQVNNQQEDQNLIK